MEWMVGVQLTVPEHGVLTCLCNQPSAAPADGACPLAMPSCATFVYDSSRTSVGPCLLFALYVHKAWFWDYEVAGLLLGRPPRPQVLSEGGPLAGCPAHCVLVMDGEMRPANWIDGSRVHY
eukprot:TRINITY_DN284_c0_g1_i1.p1 TRINITY_DN284_c0_g1~~TRINITY_DN284_c0_g1_i1.p1  ORF type:complete len:121 (-),score=3.21 TRINITY_DN284_c0_g1_i1:565-927(-)